MESSIYKTVLVAMVIMMFLVLSSFTMKEFFEFQKDKETQKGFAVLELFTSQGCSSCPPADKVLAEYAKQNSVNILPLSFHVDYWNYIGWKDPFSKAQFTDRQRNYSQLLKVESNYTPQLVINGKHELVGSYKEDIKNLVDKELKLLSKFDITIKKTTTANNQLTVEFHAAKYPNSTINLALVKKREITSIKRGENKGLQQINYNIVFDFKEITNHSSENHKAYFDFNPNWSSTDFMVVAFIQNTKSGAILGATKSEIN